MVRSTLSADSRAPDWHVALKKHLEPQVGGPQRLALAATAAGYPCVDATVMSVPSGLITPAELVRWRLGTAGVAEEFRRRPMTPTICR